ncbi:MAG TPA: hypothetical protein PK431_10770 [Chitinophagales bacterium]|nr:hypothetical protein [Chitinophagales bacterium]
MTKNEFVTLAKSRGINECRYSGKEKIMYIFGTANNTSAFISFCKNLVLPFKVV